MMKYTVRHLPQVLLHLIRLSNFNETDFGENLDVQMQIDNQISSLLASVS